MKLEVLHGDHVVLTREIGGGLMLGRSSSNDLVLRDGGVSGRHASVFREGDRLFVRDLGSTNGTFVGDRRVDGTAELAVGDLLSLGPEARVRVAEADPAPPAPLRVEQLDGPLAIGVREARVAIPGGELLFCEDAVWLAVGGTETARLEVGEPFVCGPHTWVLREDHHTATVRPIGGPLPYQLRVDLSDGEAVLAGEGRSCRFRAENRVSLLAALAARREEAGPARGWMDDDDLRRAVWGRERWQKLPNNLNVLVHRVREQAERAGFQRWFVERRPGRTRLQVVDVALVRGGIS